MNHALLPSVNDARLPARYEAARIAIRECGKVDECKDWADKAQALASYAKQSKDKELENTAMRIRARAIRRCGELLKEVERAQGARTDLRPRTATDPRFPSRKDAATGAGLSPRQAKSAIRVANVPEDDFDEQVDSDTPPTVTALAEQGKRSRDPLRQAKPLYEQMGISIEAFQAGMYVPGGAETYLNNLERYDAATVAEGVIARNHQERMRSLIERIDAYHDRLMAKLL